jgi:hypothetical protein
MTHTDPNTRQAPGNAPSGPQGGLNGGSGPREASEAGNGAHAGADGLGGEQEPRGPIDWARQQQAEREARQTAAPAATEATESAPWPQLEARAFNAVQPALQAAGAWLPMSVRRAVAKAVLAAVQPHLAGHYQHAVDAAVAAEQRANQAAAAIARVRALHTKDGDHCAICTEDFGRLSAPWPCPTIRALDDPPAHNAGPSVRECAEADRRWWNAEKAGE